MRSLPLPRIAVVVVVVAGALGGWLALAWPACGGEAAPARVYTVHVAEAGAVGDGKTDDGPAIREAIARAVAHNGPSTVCFDAKTYRIGPWNGRWCALPMVNARDVTLDGGGALLVVHPKNRALLLLGCRNVTVRNFRIDYDPLPFTQGDVVAVNAAAGTFDVRLHAGYPDPPSEEWAEANYPARMGWRHGCFLAPDRRAYTHNWVYVDAVHHVTGSGRTYRVTVDPGHRHNLKTVEAGQRFAFRRRVADKAWRDAVTRIGKGDADRGVYVSNPAASIQVRWSLDCTIEAIDHYVSPNMVVRLTGSDGIHVRRLRVTYKPGTDRLVASLSDGIHAKGCRVGPFIEECVFEGLFDDSVNISTHPDVVLEKQDATHLRTRYADIAYYDSCLRAGDVVTVWDQAAGRALGEARVAEARFVRSHVRDVTLDHAVDGISDARAVGHDKAARLYVKKRRDAEVCGCTFRSQLKTAMLLRDPVLCEGNHVVDCAYGVHVCNSAKFDEGPPPYRAHIVGNHFERVTVGAVVMLATGPAGGIEPFGERFLVADNRIDEAVGYGISLANLRNVVLRENTIQMARQAAKERTAVNVRNCAWLDVRGLRVTDLRPDSRGALVLEQTPAGHVHLVNLVSDLAEGVPAVKR